MKIWLNGELGDSRQERRCLFISDLELLKLDDFFLFS